MGARNAVQVERVGDKERRGSNAPRRQSAVGDSLTLTLLNKLSRVKRTLESKHALTFFGAFQRDGSQWWDVLVGGAWIEKDEEAALKEIAKTLNRHLNRKDIVQVSHIAVVNPDLPEWKAFRVKGSGRVSMHNRVINGMQIREAHVWGV
ncbi:MAG: hypothetical protein M5U26_03225 [Planctomycetota bacterium]|nr:hypothetical protein [Planctomycetota bacterium]